MFSRLMRGLHAMLCIQPMVQATSKTRKTREKGRKWYLANMHISPLGVPPLLEEQIYSFKCTSLAREWGRSLNSHHEANMTTSFIFSRKEVKAQWGLGGSITDFCSLLPPVCLLTAALPLALVPRNCNPASPGLLLLLLRSFGGSPASCRVRASSCTSVPP